MAKDAAIYKFRRRFANLLIAVGLIYIGAAIGATYSQPVSTTTQQFTTSPVPSQGLGLSKSAAQPQKTSVLSQSTSQLSSNAPNPFVPKCTYQPIPYKTIYKVAPWLDAGQTITIGGMDGEQRICSTATGVPAATTLIPPLDKTVTNGTYVPASSYPDTGGSNDSGQLSNQ